MLKKIANYFSVSIDYLLDNETDKTTEEVTLLNGYRSLSDEDKMTFKGILYRLQFTLKLKKYY